MQFVIIYIFGLCSGAFLLYLIFWMGLKQNIKDISEGKECFLCKKAEINCRNNPTTQFWKNLNE